MAATNIYYQGISISPVWDNRFLFLCFLFLSLWIMRPCCIPAANRSALSCAEVHFAGKEGVQCRANHPRRHWKRWRGLVGITSSGHWLQKTCWEIQLRGCWHLCASLHAKEIKKLLHLSDAIPPLLFATVSLWWFENKMGIPNCERTLVSFHCMRKFPKGPVPQCEL